MNRFLPLYRKLREEYEIFARKKYTTIAGALVFFLILSVLPFFFWGTLLFGKFLVGSEEFLDREAYGGIGELISFLRTNAEEASSGATFFLGATTLYSASNFFYHLRRCGEMIYGIAPKKQSGKVRFFALIATIVTILFLSLFWSLFLGMVWVFRLIFPAFLAETSVYFLSAGIEFLTCFALNVYLCPLRFPWKKYLRGSLTTTLLWGVALVLFSVYIRFGNIRKLYGAMTTVVVILLWTYYMTICFVVGIIVNARENGRESLLNG